MGGEGMGRQGRERREGGKEDFRPFPQFQI